MASLLRHPAAAAQMQRIKAELTKRSSDSRFFSTTKRGELHELREELNGSDVNKQKNAIKKVWCSLFLLHCTFLARLATEAVG